MAWSLYGGEAATIVGEPERAGFMKISSLGLFFWTAVTLVAGPNLSTNKRPSVEQLVD